jgi:hypothetical protein
MAEVDYRDSPSDEDETGTVAIPERAEVVEVVEGVVVDDAPVPAPAPLRVVQVVRVVVQHEHAKTAGRHLAYVPIGASVVARRMGANLWAWAPAPRGERVLSRHGMSEMWRYGPTSDCAQLLRV